ncbi:MAG: hypothetical protein N2110_04505 [Flavobacteriales bacterium]|nr:hypothetical protein [Flavobacteriales bacterium]MCX7768271.1 hypothetical protein [Flavobacteriales bacterium]MDW8410836.1 hypothetical protein [Flavobacteriales bacterium]
MGTWACGSEKPASPETTKFPHPLLLTIIRDTVGTFRGVDIGEERAVVEYLEGINVQELSNRSALVVRQDFPGNNCLYVRYVFLASGRLGEIVADAYLERIELGTVLAEALRQYFDRRWGPAQSAMGVWSWRTRDVSGQYPVRIELRDESEEYGYGKVNITVYPEPL